MNVRFAARVAAVIAALGASLVSGAQNATADVGDPPQIIHVPTVVAPFNEPIEIAATGRCATSTCSMTLGYRTSTGFLDFTGEREPDAFTEVTMSAANAQAVPDGSFARDFDGTIPASVATTEGVDYYLHLTDGDLETHFPIAGGSWHIEVLTRPTVTHAPRVSYEPGQSIRIEAHVTASTGTPVVTLSYGVAGNKARQTVAMVLRATAVDADGVATAWAATAAIPSSYTAAGQNVLYSLRMDDGFQSVTSPAFKDDVSAETSATGTLTGTITVSVGEWVVHPFGHSL